MRRQQGVQVLFDFLLFQMKTDLDPESLPNPEPSSPPQEIEDSLPAYVPVARQYFRRVRALPQWEEVRRCLPFTDSFERAILRFLDDESSEKCQLAAAKMVLGLLKAVLR
ncbi:MAG: hypothetical protein AAB074_02230 [Planctomycetota bacterium]